MNINFDQAIPSIVEAMLPRFSPKKLGLSITLDLRDDNFIQGPEEGLDDMNPFAATIVRFIFHRPSNYTKVLVNYEFNNFHDMENNPMYNTVYFEKHSDHDSCWRSDGLRILRSHRDNVEDYLNINYNKVSTFYNFSMFDPIKYIKFETLEPVKSDKYNNIIGYNIKVSPISIEDHLKNLNV